MPELIACNLCGCKEEVFLFETHDRLVKLPGSYRFVRCRVCGLVYVNPQPTWEERQAHYDLTGYPGYLGLKTVESTWQKRSLKYGLAKRQRLLERFLPGGRLLDVGSGVGDFPHWLRQSPQWQVFALERLSNLAAVAHDDSDLAVIAGDLSSAGLAAGAFDGLTLWTVLEHLQDPLAGLSECARLLRRGGILLLRTATLESWASHLFRAYWLGYDAPRILFVFSKPLLKRYLDQTGFDLLYQGSYFHDYYPYLWSLGNWSREASLQPRLLRLINRAAASWLARLITHPFFWLQTQIGGDSFVTLLACKR